TGKNYRLLSEVEREYVTRAGTATPFWWGSSISTSQANYDGRFIYGGGAKGEFRRRTLPVDSFQPNTWGLFQVHGNVWEWVEDCWHESYQGARQQMVRPGRPVTVVVASSAVGPMAAIPGSSARPTASGSPPATGISSW